jgi:2-(1,2-epoxy-1,2-dihydrophenyl)acetyl-CoA isomerase
MYDHVSYEESDGIAKLEIDRPDVYNAFTPQTIDELNDALQRAEQDEIFALTLTGAGEGFCTGADISAMPDWAELSKDEYASFLRDVQSVVQRLQGSAVPSVAAVDGPAVGAGCDFALACDARFIDPDAFLREGFVRVGLVPGDGGAWLLPKLIGESKAREYLLTGDDITASDADDLGLVVDVTSEPLQAAIDFAERIRDLPATAVQRTNQLIDMESTFDEHCEQAIDYQWECVNDPEHEEAVAALREDRQPSYDR